MNVIAIRTLNSLLLILFVMSPPIIWAQTQDQDLQQLKDKLQKLEQEVQELKGQLSKAQAAPAPSAPRTAVIVRAQEEADETPAAPIEEKEKKKNSVDIYGHVMLDSGYEFGQSDPNWFDVVRPTKLASKPGEFAPDGKVFFSVRQTRFGVKTATPTGLGDLKTIFEFELFGTGVDAGQTTFRLRHAYGELGHFGAGQTWSPFMDIDVFPNSLEYWGPNGMVFFRNIQVRWAPIQNDRTRLIFAAERPGASADGGIYADRVELAGVKPKFDMPGLFRAGKVYAGVGLCSVGGDLSEDFVGRHRSQSSLRTRWRCLGLGHQRHFEREFHQERRRACRFRLWGRHSELHE